MTGEKLWEQYQNYTRDVTEHSRTLGFAGCGVCWLFKQGDFTFPPLIYLSLFFFVSFFAFDIMHPFTGALMVKWFTEGKEKEMWNKTWQSKKPTVAFDSPKPRWVDLPAFVCFVAKCLFLIAGFIVLALHLILLMATHTPEAA